MRHRLLVLPETLPLVLPRAVVPAGRIGYDLAAPDLLLHSFLAPDAYAELVSLGRITARTEHVDLELSELAYRWMAEQLHHRVGAPPGAWPLWAWARTTRAALVSDAARYVRLAPGTVMVTCRVPHDRVLLSSYSDWHAPLNGIPVLDRELTEDALDEALERWWAELDATCPGWTAAASSHWPAAIRERLQDSWPAIFEPGLWSRGEPIQACLGHLEAGDIVDAVRLVARTPRGR